MRRVTICGVVVSVIVLALAMARPADGAKRYRAAGSPGAATMPPVRGWWFYTEPALIRFMPRLVWRSPAYRSYSQRICVEYRTYAFTPGRAEWGFDWKRSSCINVRPGYRASFSQQDYRAQVPLKAYNVEVWVTWDVGSRRIGSARWDYNNVNDYRCQTPNCYADYGYGDVAYIMFDV
jgi:hypothetical protein